MAHVDIPKPLPNTLTKDEVLRILEIVDGNPIARDRVLLMETQFRHRIATLLNALPSADRTFSKFSTSPYVLLFFAAQKSYSHISQIEADIVPAKVFSSMETSAGRMIEQVVLPAYGWDCVGSSMHSSNSALDGRRVMPTVSCVATLKSGPRCLNDEMSENFADSIMINAAAWASDGSAARLEFTYGVLYGTQKQSNKKDWHILRNLAEKVPNRGGVVVSDPKQKWSMEFELDGVSVEASIRIGLDWWLYLGGPTCAVEVWTALIRACVAPGPQDDPDRTYVISDLGEIVATGAVADDFNVSLLQRSQIPWLFFVARHFCDRLV